MYKVSISGYVLPIIPINITMYVYYRYHIYIYNLGFSIGHSSKSQFDGSGSNGRHNEPRISIDAQSDHKENPRQLGTDVDSDIPRDC